MGEMSLAIGDEVISGTCFWASLFYLITIAEQWYYLLPVWLNLATICHAVGAALLFTICEPKGDKIVDEHLKPRTPALPPRVVDCLAWYYGIHFYAFTYSPTHIIDAWRM